jgi:uncharacterized repeat protein (TIGR03803 family)
MHQAKLSCVLNCGVAVLIVSLLSGSSAAAVKGKLLNSFNLTNGANPTGSLAFDTSGNLYGTTDTGGAGAGCVSSGCGTVYELSPSVNGWTETVLHTFMNGSDGGGPQSGVILDNADNLYGTTLFGGAGNGCGTIFELTQVSGSWTNNVLHSFDSSSGDGCFPYNGLTFDKAGNLYGTTASGGTNDAGVVFELTPNADGGWSYSVIYTFQPGGSGDGVNPFGTLVVDGAGDLYGTTYGGGIHQAGSVFSLVPANGGWTETVIYSFTGGTTGTNPYAGVIFDKNGNLYGTTYQGGAGNVGVVFELTVTNGNWTIQVLHAFTGALDGGHPSYGSLLIDAVGNLYGETFNGGHGQFGVAFQLIPVGGGGWTENVLHHFVNGIDGSNPVGGLIFDSAGDLYGTDAHGGVGGYGIAFEGQLVTR